MGHITGIFLLWMTSSFLSCDCRNRTWAFIVKIGGNAEWVHLRVWENRRKTFGKLFKCFFWDLGIWETLFDPYFPYYILSKPNSHNLKTTDIISLQIKIIQYIETMMQNITSAGFLLHIMYATTKVRMQYAFPKFTCSFTFRCFMIYFYRICFCNEQHDAFFDCLQRSLETMGLMEDRK